MEIPFLPKEELRRFAGRFLAEHNPKGSIPVPIEGIVEFNFKLDIVPAPGLLKVRGINGFLTSDRSSIFVDQSLLESARPRYFFTLAHELAHLILHGRFYETFKTEEAWRAFHKNLATHVVLDAEWQADTFAGLILVPPSALERELKQCYPRLTRVVLEKEAAFDLTSEALWHYIAKEVGRVFRASGDTARIRLENDGLWRKPLR